MSDEFHILPAATRRDLDTPVRLLLESHRPLAFIAGQALYLIAPLAALLGEPRIQTWAARLSAPQLDSSQPR
jgi:hypothetical protein